MITWLNCSKKKGYPCESKADREKIRRMKEYLCSMDMEVNGTASVQSPMGFEEYASACSTFGLGKDEAIRCTDVLFDPKDIGRKIGVHQMMVESITKCDVSIQQELCNNIVLAGGTTNIGQYRDRLKHEVQTLTANRIHVHDDVHEYREYLPWLGGSLFSKSSDLSNLWVSKKQYYEDNRSCLHTKCF